MKQKVLTYGNDGNTVVNKYIELTPVSYHSDIFTTPLDEWKRTELIFKFKDVYYCEGNYEMKQMQDNETMVINTYTNYLDNLHINGGWIKTIYIVLFETLGLPTTLLKEVRAKQIEAREAKKKEETAKKENEKELQRQSRLSELSVSKNKLSAGEKISKDDFIDLIKMYNIPIHIRTIGMLNKLQRADIGKDQAEVFGSNTKNMNFQKVFEAAKLLANC